MTMFAHTAENQSWLRARWQALMMRLRPERAAADAAWDGLVRHYAERHRAYHNFSHIMALLRHADIERSLIHRPEIVELAIWFHDVIYDTHATDNEQRSAAWARHALQAMRVDTHIIEAVEQCILATQSHGVSASHVIDLPLFHDLDLAILGAQADVYRQYCQAIRAEYDWVPEQDYRRGRSEVLKSFLERPSLFFTPAMAAHYEERARHNLGWELQELAS